MTKAAHMLTTLLFAIVCGALWYIWRLAREYVAIHLGGGDLSQQLTIAFLVAQWLFVLPVPNIIYSAVLMDRVDLPVEKATVYFVVISIISVALVFATIILFGMEAVRVGGPMLGQ